MVEAQGQIHLVIEPVLSPVRGPLALRSYTRTTCIAAVLEVITPEVIVEDTSSSGLRLVVQLMDPTETVGGRPDSLTGHHPNIYSYPSDGIGSKLVQLNFELVQDLRYNPMTWKPKAHLKEILEHHYFIVPRLRSFIS